MLNDAAVSQFKKVYLAPGYTDLRRGIDGLASMQIPAHLTTHSAKN